MIKRDLYINQLQSYIGQPLIKVITGIRRCGKSVLLMLLKDALLQSGISDSRIIYINFESFQYSDIKEAKHLYDYVKNIIGDKTGRFYIMLDEVQEVSSWEKAINSFSVDFDVDIYLTGSNSRMLSGELATYLAGRYIELSMFPLSFKEFLIFRDSLVPQKEHYYEEFDRFLHLGGFPVIHMGNYTDEESYKIVLDIYSSVILRDAVQRNNIRDVELLDRVVKYVFDNIGNKFSAKNVADYFKSQNRKLDLNTVYNYLNALESAFIIYRIPRYDIKGKEILKTNEKYFVGDQSLVYAVMGYRDRNISGMLENIIMLELKRRGLKVFVGKLDNIEVDFIAEKAGRRIYIQVSYKLSEQSTIDREYKPLLAIKDNYPKYVVTMEQNWHDNIDGIIHCNIADFLLLDSLL